MKHTHVSLIIVAAVAAGSVIAQSRDRDYKYEKVKVESDGNRKTKRISNSGVKITGISDVSGAIWNAGVLRVAMMASTRLLRRAA